MSYSTVFRIRHDGQVEEAYRHGNSWLFAAKIWTMLWDKYIKPTVEESRRDYLSWIHGMEHAKKVWDLMHDERLSRSEKLALASTFDGVWVPRSMIIEVSNAIHSVGASIGALGALANEDIRGVCFTGTSVGESQWHLVENEGTDDEDWRLLNLDKDPNCANQKPHWSLLEDFDETPP